MSNSSAKLSKPAAHATGGGRGMVLPEPSPGKSGAEGVCVREDAAAEVDAAALRQYRERGYVVGPQLLDKEAVATLRREFQRLFDGERDFEASPYEYARWRDVVALPPDHRGLKKLNNAWWLNASMRKVVTSPVIGEIAGKLMETDAVRLWHDQAIWKPGQRQEEGGWSAESNVGWHQDYAHWQVSDTPNMCTAFIALQDTDLTNGGLRTIVGSHKWGLLEDANAFFEKDLDKLASEHQSKRLKTETDGEGAQQREWRDEPTILKAGQAAFHHALTIHGSGPNMTSEPRMAIAVHMQPGDCGFSGARAWHQNLKDLGPGAAVGARFQGPLWPVLWSSAPSAGTQ